jgi:hypothetical protein
MNKNNHYIRQIIKQFWRRTIDPTEGDKRFAIALMIGLVFYGLICLALLRAPLVIFRWVLYGRPAVILSAEVVAISWRIRDIIKQMKVNEQEE